tara:strand:+ start:892 stop:1224 length:333 start_codon:yes stop_codon:yes gene_type:complete
MKKLLELLTGITHAFVTKKYNDGKISGITLVDIKVSEDFDTKPIQDAIDATGLGWIVTHFDDERPRTIPNPAGQQFGRVPHPEGGTLKPSLYVGVSGATLDSVADELMAL